MRPLLVGEAPSQAGIGQPPFSGGGSSRKRLEQLLGLSDIETYLDTANLISYYPGRSYPICESRTRALQLLHSHDRFVTCGRNVARAFGRPVDPPLTVFRNRKVELLILPHPSGLSRWWNDPDNIEAASTALRRFVFPASTMPGHG